MLLPRSRCVLLGTAEKEAQVSKRGVPRVPAPGPSNQQATRAGGVCVRSRCTRAGPRLLRDDAGNGGSLEKGRIVAGRAFVHFWRAFTWMRCVRSLH